MAEGTIEHEEGPKDITMVQTDSEDERIKLDYERAEIEQKLKGEKVAVDEKAKQERLKIEEKTK